ncbi:MAG: cell division protein SepF [Candidatus Bathyarchaeia archaeon]
MSKTDKVEESQRRDGGAFVGLPAPIYVKAMPLRHLSDVDMVKSETRSGNIVIALITPMAKRSVDEVKQAVDELCDFIEILGGDIARLGEERLVITPPHVKIWKRKIADTTT